MAWRFNLNMLQILGKGNQTINVLSGIKLRSFTHLSFKIIPDNPEKYSLNSLFHSDRNVIFTYFTIILIPFSRKKKLGKYGPNLPSSNFKEEEETFDNY